MCSDQEWSVSVLPDLFGEMDDTERRNTFLHDIFPLCFLESRQAVVGPPSGAHLCQPGIHHSQELQVSRNKSFSPIPVQEEGLSCSVCVAAQLFGYQNSLFMARRGKKKKGGLHHLASSNKTKPKLGLQIICHACSQWFVLEEKKTKDEEFSYLNASLEVENSNIL